MIDCYHFKAQILSIKEYFFIFCFHSKILEKVSREVFLKLWFEDH